MCHRHRKSVHKGIQNEGAFTEWATRMEYSPHFRTFGSDLLPTPRWQLADRKHFPSALPQLFLSQLSLDWWQ
jgi:hypothetical protein